MEIVPLLLENWWIFGAVFGSYLLWRFYGSRIVLKYAGLALENWIMRAYKEPQGHESTVVGQLAGLLLAHMMEQIPELVPENPAEAAHPSMNLIFRRLETHLEKSLSAALGRQIQRIDGAMKDADSPEGAMALAFGGGSGPDGLTQMLTMLRMLNKSGVGGKDGFL